MHIRNWSEAGLNDVLWFGLRPNF